MRTLSNELWQHPGERVTVEGWVHRRRALAGFTFLILRDRAGLTQVVARAAEVRRALETYGEETVVRVSGIVTSSEQAPGGVELTEPDITPLCRPAAPSPLELWRPQLTASLPTLLDNAALSWRHPAQRAVWRLAASTLRGFRLTLDDLGFTEIMTPKLVGGSTESGANVFEVGYFSGTAYLAQSPQFYKQTMVGVFERVYETGPVFRAEPHDTARHLAEYVSLDAELGFIGDHRDVLVILREVLAGMVSAIGPDDAAESGARLPVVPEEIPIVHFRDALALVGAPADEPDLAPEHERALGAWALAEHDSDFVAVEGYPAAKRPFYTAPSPGDDRWTNSFDLLFRGLELVTGGQRRHEYDEYVGALLARGEDPADYAGYLQAFRHGMPPHGGFAIGLERWVARLVEAPNIRSCTLFPRDLHRLAP